MFVFQRLLEAEGKLTLLDQSKVITPHPQFRIFATANTLGFGDSSGMYHGTHALNQAQIDRWNIVSQLNYLEPEQELKIILSKVPNFAQHPQFGEEAVRKMVKMAGLIRKGFMLGDLSITISPRTLISWADNCLLFKDITVAFTLSFLNKCDELERPIVYEYYQRCFDLDLSVKPASEHETASNAPDTVNVSSNANVTSSIKVSSGW